MRIKKRFLFVLLIPVLYFWLLGIRDEKYKYYTYDSDPAKTFEEGLQIIDLAVTGKSKLYNFFVYSRVTRYSIDKVSFTIQGDDKPLKKNLSMNVSKVILQNKDNELESTSFKKEFYNEWSFDYTGEIKPDFVDPDIRVTSKSYDPVNDTIMGSLNTNDDNLGSYYFVFEFDEELKDTDEFQILIYYTSDYNSEEKVLEVNAEFSGFLEKRTYAYDREMARY